MQQSKKNQTFPKIHELILGTLKAFDSNDLFLPTENEKTRKVKEWHEYLQFKRAECIEVLTAFADISIPKIHKKNCVITLLSPFDDGPLDRNERKILKIFPNFAVTQWTHSDSYSAIEQLLTKNHQTESDKKTQINRYLFVLCLNYISFFCLLKALLSLVFVQFYFDSLLIDYFFHIVIERKRKKILTNPELFHDVKGTFSSPTNCSTTK